MHDESILISLVTSLYRNKHEGYISTNQDEAILKNNIIKIYDNEEINEKFNKRIIIKI